MTYFNGGDGSSVVDELNGETIAIIQRKSSHLQRVKKCINYLFTPWKQHVHKKLILNIINVMSGP